MTTKVLIDGKSFEAIPEHSLFLLVSEGESSKRMGKTIYQKCHYPPFNAVQQNVSNEVPDRGWILVGERQLVIPLE